MAAKVKTGVVTVKHPFNTDYFDEDDRLVVVNIKPGEYEYQVLDVNGFKPRQLKINGEWIDVMGRCEELEELLSLQNESDQVDETTGVGNIAPTVDYLGHDVINIPGTEPVYPDEGEEEKQEKDKDHSDTREWTAPIGRILAGESVRTVIGGLL